MTVNQKYIDSLPISERTELLEFIQNKLSSKFWRLDNLYTIEDKDGIKQLMKLNNSQIKVLKKFNHTRKIILKSRQQGISTLYLAYNLDSCIFGEGFSAGIQSYGQDESNKLQRRAELMWDEFPQYLKDLLGIKMLTNNQKGMSFSNRSILKIGNFRGDTLQSLHVSELGKIAKKFPEKAEELKKGAFQSVGKNNKITIESTAEGKSGMFYDMWAQAELLQKTGRGLGPFDFQAIFLSWMEDHDCNLDHETPLTEDDEKHLSKLEQELGIVLTKTQKWWYAAKKMELAAGFDQEYPATPEMAFAQSVEGTYYANEFKTLVYVDNNYDPNLKVHSAFDLGMNDTFAIGFFQKHPDGHIELIGEYLNSGHGLEFYRDIFDALNKKFGWVHGETYVPHDSKVRELIADKTRWDALRELGFNPILVRKHRLADGIEATRQFLKNLRINRDCEETIRAIQNYRKKYDAKYDVYLDTPVHDEHSHAADMIRYLAMGDKRRPITDMYVTPQYISRTSTNIISGFDV